MYKRLRLLLSFVPALAAIGYLLVGLPRPRLVLEQPGPGEPAAFIPAEDDGRTYIVVEDPDDLSLADILRVYRLEFIAVGVATAAILAYAWLVVMERRGRLRREFARLEAAADAAAERRGDGPRDAGSPGVGTPAAPEDEEPDSSPSDGGG